MPKPPSNFIKPSSVCIIPARGGSKRIKNKNLRSFRGYPIIHWSIRAAIAAGCFDRIIVSTDSSAISSIAISAGAEVPFLRPKHLSDDFTGTREVIHHAIDQLSLNSPIPQFVCCLYATAPFVSSVDIIKGLDLLHDSLDGTVVFTATSFEFPIQRALRINDQGYSSPFDSTCVNKRSQDLEEFYHDAGQFYWATASTWSSNFSLFAQGRPILLPRWRVQDIDTEEDWKCAEIKHMALDMSDPSSCS